MTCHSLISLPGSKDSSDECKDSSSVTYSLISSDEMGIFSKDIDSETEEIAVTSLEPYQFEPADAYSSNSDEPSEDECASSDEEKLPDDMSWYKHLIIILFLCLMI